MPKLALYLRDFPAREVFYLVTHYSLELQILLSASTMHCIERAILVPHKFMRKGRDKSLVFITFCQMHSCKDVGRGLANHILCLAYDVYNTLVRTSSKEYCIAVFFNDEILLMGEGVVLCFGWSE